MPLLELSQIIDRPPDVVFRFIATDHVLNHPRWDPNMHLEQVTPGPIRVGTLIRRRYVQDGAEVQGEMEVVELEQDRAFATVIRDGPVELRGRLTFEPEGERGTLLGMTLEASEHLVRMDPMRAPIQRTLDNMKRLIEAET